MRRLCLPALLCLGVCVPAAAARPPHKQSLLQFFGPTFPKKLDTCAACHLPDPPGQEMEGEKAFNPFGERLANVKKVLRKEGKSTSIDARLAAVLDEDSDGDGTSNRDEILLARQPGDRNDKPNATELNGLKNLATAFVKHQTAYPWRPFEKVQRPLVPSLRTLTWGRNPIDAFIGAEHEALGLTPRPEAGKATLLRRVYLDLIGLSPTPAELNAFLQDASPDAYEKTVDQLLASPRYGERWGRHWMDVWRYSDWAGFGPQIRDSQPHIWRWRDWIIESLNNDKGYDRMVLEMLAGDELAPEDPRALAATGYLVRNYKLLSREKWMQDTVEHTSMAFLSITLGCARCHDHMYDPFSQREYYQVRAIFEPHQVRIDRLPGSPDPAKNGLVRAYDAKLDEPTYLFLRGDDRTPDKSKPVPPGVPESLGITLEGLEPVSLPRSSVKPDRQPFVLEEMLQASRLEVKRTEDLLKAARTQGAQVLASFIAAPFAGHSLARLAPSVETTRFLGLLELAEMDFALARAKDAALVAELAFEAIEEKGTVKSGPEWTAAATKVNLAQRSAELLSARRNHAAARQAHESLKVADAAKRNASLKSLEATQAKLTLAEAEQKKPGGVTFTPRKQSTYPAQSSGRRLAFARWIANRHNPLTARVAVNHIWLRHFGQALVPSVFDFGRNGRPATHPALLDWLAAEFMDQQWSQKAIHRLIVTSSTYRMASTADDKNVAVDRDNKYLWRYPGRRVEAEVVRDCLLHVAGQLDGTMGGPDIDYPLGLKVPRRSLYFRHAAEKQMEFLQIFDAAAVSECYERKHSIIPQQALALFNSEIALRNGRLLARSLNARESKDAAFIKAAFESVLSRAPTTAEEKDCLDFLGEAANRFQEPLAKTPAAAPANGDLPANQPALRARENLVHVLLNHHEFVTVR